MADVLFVLVGVLMGTVLNLLYYNLSPYESVTDILMVCIVLASCGVVFVVNTATRRQPSG
jgi:hypothetical protein